MTSKKKAAQIEHRIALCQEFTGLWADYFEFFGDGFEERKVTGETEAQFFRIMTDIARKEYRVEHFLKGCFGDGPRIIDLLGQSASLTQLHEMSEGQFSKFQYEWHAVFIALNKALGKLIEERPEPKSGETNPLKNKMREVAAENTPRPEQPPQA